MTRQKRIGPLKKKKMLRLITQRRAYQIPSKYQT